MKVFSGYVTSHKYRNVSSKVRGRGNWDGENTVTNYCVTGHKIKQEHYIIHPRHSGETKIGCYMTLIRNEIHDIERNSKTQTIISNIY